MTLLIDWSYIVAAILFILGLKLLGKQATARKGNLLSAVGMLIAIVATLLVSGLHYQWIIVGLVIGSAIGGIAAQRVQMTAMPEMVALFNGAGGLSSLLVGWVEYHNHPVQPVATTVPIFLAVLIGGVTLTGSVLAYAKLAEKIQTRPILFSFQQPIHAGLVLR
ncbi:MAG: NAD(P)(+) transhydrogenase (Re/Si-specific) subunit beta, partial [Chthoniobacterales bacterium]